MTDARSERAIEDVVAVETIAPGMARVVTFSDAYVVDVRDGGCTCPDKQYNGVPRCKHEHAAIMADVDRLPSPAIVSEDLDARPVATDGGRETDELRIYDADDAGRPKVERKQVSHSDTATHATYTKVPSTLAALVDGARTAVADLSPAEREWVDAVTEA